MTQKNQPRADYLFEISWEVANKVGGIYTVLTTKAGRLLDYYPREHYFLIGPYIFPGFKDEFREEKPPAFLAPVFERLSKEGIRCHFGIWLISGEPWVILIDFRDFFCRADEIKKELWENFGIDSLLAGPDFNEPAVWSWAAGRLVELVAEQLKGKKIVVQFHEWLSGAGLLYLKKQKVKAGTVFTTHATILGRTLAGAGLPLYDLIEKLDPENEAYKHRIHFKHQLEKGAALASDVFSTVSETTAWEAQNFLGRKPDILLPNGINLENFPSLEDLFSYHRLQRNRLREFLISYFFPYYTFDIQNTLFYSILGRYEFRNKGVDIFIKALGRLNQRLKNKNDSKTVAAFFWLPAENRGVKNEVKQARENLRDIAEVFEEVEEETRLSLFLSLLSGQKSDFPELWDEKFLLALQKKILKFKAVSGNPPLCTHELADPNDPIIRDFKEAGLYNLSEDKVKVIFSPIYLTGDDSLFNLDYYESLTACHLGVFPSFYEPWGYTPLDALASGVAAVTTDLAGFGRFFLEKFKGEESAGGLFVLKRQGKNNEEAAGELAEILFRFSLLSKEERGKVKMRAREIAAAADWKILITNYIEAHNKAVSEK